MRIDHYDWSGGREAMLRFGPSTGPVAVVALPLFEEANRTRSFAVTICRALAKRGVASVLPDLPGQGESLVPTEAMRLYDGLWAAFAAVTARFERAHTVAIRGGALVTMTGTRRSSWVFAPVDGSALLRDLQRARDLIGSGTPALAMLAGTAPAGTIVEASGNRFSTDFLLQLMDAIPASPTPNRVVRLESDPGDADRHVPGTPLWRRAEPDNDPALAALLAEDIADWIATCEG